MLPRPKVDETKLERACIKVLQQADRGRFTAASADGQTHRVVDSAFASVGWMYMDLERALVELEAIVELQQPDGCIPREAESDGASAPLLATIIRMIYHSARSRNRRLEGRLAALVPAVDLYHVHLMGRDQRWLCRVSADDERLAPDPTEGFAPIPDVGFNALLVQAETDLADVSIDTGYPTRQIIARRTHRARAVAQQLWSDERALFVPPSVGDAPPRRGSVGGLLPIWSGAALGHQARAMVNRHLGPDAPLMTTYPLASSTPGEPWSGALAPHGGAMTPLLNWLLVRGAYRYGFEPLASQLENAVIAAVDKSGIWEAYHPVTGEGLGAPGSTLTAVIALDLLKTPYVFERWGVY